MRYTKGVSSLIKHISEVHEVKKPLKSGVCDLSFSKMGNLTTHTASVHNVTFVTKVFCKEKFKETLLVFMKGRNDFVYFNQGKKS